MYEASFRWSHKGKTASLESENQNNSSKGKFERFFKCYFGGWVMGSGCSDESGGVGGAVIVCKVSKSKFAL